MDHADAIAALEARRTILRAEIVTQSGFAEQHETQARAIRERIALAQAEMDRLSGAIEELGGMPS